MKALMRKLASGLRRLSPLSVTTLALGCVLALGVVDYFTPGPISFVVFYMLVVVSTGWGAGRWEAVVVSAVAAATMATLQWGLHHGTPASDWVALWNDTTRFLAFSLTGWLTAELARLNRHLGKLVEERTAQWKREAEGHKATSIKLGEALERFEQVINNITEVFWLADVSKKEVAYISPGYERVWGRKCADVYRDPQSWAESVHPDDRELVQRRSDPEQAQGGYDVEYRIVRPDGAVRWIRDRAFPVRNTKGEVYRIAGLAVDFTERRRTREQLETQAAILENMAEGVVVTDQQGRVVQINPAGERIWGYPREAVIGQSVTVFSALPEPKARDLLREVLAALEATGSWRGTFRNRRKDGSIILCQAVISWLEIQGRTLMVAVEQDVTERVRTQDQLQMQARVLESMAEAVLAVDEEGTITLANPAADALLGYERGELLGTPMLQLAGFPPAEFFREFRRHMEEIRARGSPAGEYLARRKDGSVIEVSVRNSGVAVGDRLHLVVVGQDITERKRTEQAMRQSEETLRVILNAAPMVALLADPCGRILACNQALFQSLGRIEGDLKGKVVFDLMPPEAASRRKPILDKVLRSREPAQFEDERDGKHFITFVSPVLDGAGNVTRVAVLALDITQRKRAERIKEAFLSLGSRLSAARSPVEAARALYATADLLWKWDAASFDLYSAESDRVQSVLNCDVLDGRRCEVAADSSMDPASERMRQIMRHGAELMLDGKPKASGGDSIRFGDTIRPSASKMYVPIRQDGQAVGVVSIQSYSPKAFTREDLQTLQALADYCSGALERIRVEQSLQQREQLNRTILATAMDGFFVLDFAMNPGGAILDINDAYSRLVGYSREELLKMRIADVEAQETPEEVARHKAQVMATGADRFETRHRRKDGKLVDVEICVSRLTGEGERVFGFVRDITGRKRSDSIKEVFLSLGAKLSAASNPVEAARALYASADQLWQWDAATLSLYSQGADLMEPVLFCDVINEHRCEVCPPRPANIPTVPGRRIMREGAELLLRGGDARVETEFHRFGDVTRVSASVMGVPVRREGQAIGVLTIQSYTPNAYTQEDLQTLQALADHCAGALERVRAEAALRESEEQMRAFYDSPGGLRGIVELLGEDILTLSANAPLALAYGRTVEGIQRIPATALGVPEPVLDLWRDKLRESWRRGIPITFEHSTGHRVPDGWALVTVCPLRVTEGAGPRFAFLSTDITNRKHAETALREDHERLEQRVRERTIELQTANAALREAHDKLEHRVEQRTAELRAANAALAESEERYRSLVNNLNVGIYRANPDGRGHFIQVNPAMARMYGFESVEEFQKVDVENFYYSASDREVYLACLLRQGAVSNYELCLKRRNGTPLYVSINATLHRSLYGKVEWIDGVVEDISERKKAEQSLADALEFNRQVVSASTVGIAAYRASGQCVMANEALAHITGGSTEQLLQQDFRRLEAWVQSGMLAKAEAALASGEAQKLEAKAHTSFGHELTINARLASFLSQGEQHLLLMVTDETEAVHAQEALRASEERYRALTESSPDAIFILNRDITVQYANSTAAALWRRQPADIIGLSQAELFPPETAREHCQVVQEVFRTGRPVRRDEPLTFPVGDQWIEIRLAPLHGDDGTVSAVMGVCREITERKRAERQLGEALDLNQKMLAVSTIGIAAYKATGECIFANEALARMMGGSMPEMLQNDFRKSVAWQRSGKLRMAEEVLRDGRARSGEFFATSRFGRTGWQDCHLAAFTSGGQPHVLEIVSEISERKRAEEALKLQSLVVQNMAEGVVLTSPEQTILFANPALEAMYGYQPGELIGQEVAVLNNWSAEETARFNAEVARAAEQGTAWRGEYQNRRKDGTFFTAEACFSGLDLGGRRHLVGVQQDITERKRADEALRESEARIRAIITRAPVLLFAVDRDGIIRFEDGQALQTLGIPPGGTLGRPVKEAYGHIPAILENSRRALQGEAFDSVVEAGQTVFNCSYSPSRDQEGRLTGYIGVATNITDRHRLERQLLEISDREQARIGQDIHDGLCQHLVSLAFDANMLRRELVSKRNAKARTARRLATLLDQAITEARQLARGLFPVRLETEGLAPALEELAKATTARFRLRCNFESKGPVAVKNATVATHLYRIAQEAVANAIRHGRASGISIRLQTRAGRLELAVEDNGSGIPAPKQKKVTGMGFHIMDYRARSIGGTLRVGPGTHGGTVVSCCAPRALG